MHGRVLDADTDAPVAGASVSIVYTDSTAEHVVDRVRRARTSEQGAFGICGLPDVFKGTIQAAKGALTTPDLPLTSGRGLLMTATLTLDVGGTRSSVVRGQVTTLAGEPLSGVQLSIEGAAPSATSGADGNYALADLPSGSQILLARKVGLLPARVPVNLSVRAPIVVPVKLAGAQTIATVTVTAQLDEALVRVGFNQRQRFGGAKFMGPKDVAGLHAQLFTDLLRGIPGIRVDDSGTGRVVTWMRGGQSGCVLLYLDRVPFQSMRAGDIDDMFKVPEIAALEAYTDVNGIPAEFRATGQPCATIVVWTTAKLQKS